MSSALKKMDRSASSVMAMAEALRRGDEQAYLGALASFDAARDSDLLTGVRKVTLDLKIALDRFRIDSKLIELTERQVPDARLRLAHVLRLTDEAAHRTMDLVERCDPLANDTARAADELSSAAVAADSEPLVAFLRLTSANMATVRGYLAEVLLAQGYQDLSGQIIRGVMALVDQLEEGLRELVAMTGDHAAPAGREIPSARGAGPMVPGVHHGITVNGQQDIDALLSDLGI